MYVIRVLVWMLVVSLLAGCGGGGGDTGELPRTAAANSMQVTYLHWIVSVPQADAEEIFQMSARWWVPQNTTQYSNVKLSIPEGSKVLPMSGPTLPQPTDGTSTSRVPVVVYWGSGESIPTGQPKIVRTGEWMPGFTRPSTPLYGYGAATRFEALAAVAGTYRLTDGANFTREWTVTTARMLPSVTVTEPRIIAVNALKPIRIAWLGVNDAKGYLVHVEGDLYDKSDKIVGHVTWTSASQALMFDAPYDFTPYLLPASAREVTVPAQAFRGCKAIQVHILAYAVPFEDTTTTPTLRVVSGSMQTQLYALFEQR